MSNAGDGARDGPRHPLPADTLIDRRYRVQSVLGRGGMGYVYRVLDTARAKVVALKQLVPHEADRPHGVAAAERTAHAMGTRLGQRTAHAARRQAQRLGLFRREFHMLAELAHPHIIGAYEFGFYGGQPYYTMELLDGHDVGRHVPLSWEHAASALRDVASALSLLHARRLLHRDISPSNVHQLADGSCKLIDFGAMSPMGADTGIVGTPPFMAPELLIAEPPDARTDLYSLGALGFYLLTGRTVFPVRSMVDLRDYMSARPNPPSAHAKLPAALDHLILQLVSPDRSARPDSTAEVIERLDALRGQEARRVPARATFGAAPALVGRRRELDAIRRGALRARCGKGHSMVVSGGPGSGRSRLLEAAALEGKLSGIVVLRGAPPEAGSEPFALLRSLLHGLTAALGEDERAELPLPAALGELMNGAPQGGDEAYLDELKAFLLRATELRPLMIVVDDVDRIDPPSLRALSTLALWAPKSKLLLLSSASEESSTNPSDELRSLALHSRRLTLSALGPDETKTLLASLFGEVPNLALVAHRVHALAGGNPRLLTELAQHLVDNGCIRFEGAAFVLPEALREGDLPETLGGVLRARVERLSEPARRLCSVLALASGMQLTPQACFALAHLGPEQGEEALAELLARYVAQLHQGQLSLRQAALGEAVAASMPEENKRALHRRLAALSESDAAHARFAPEHYFGAGEPQRAMECLLAIARSDQGMHAWHPRYRSVVERAIPLCAEQQRPARDAFTLKRSLAQQILNYNEACEDELLLSVSSQLCRLSGLSDWYELSDIADPAARLKLALGRAQARYEAAAESERILAPGEAIGQLVTYLLMLSAFASSAVNMDLLYGLPSMAPFAPLSPAIQMLELLVDGLRGLRGGAVERYLECAHQILERLERPDRGGFPEAEARNFRTNTFYGLALTQAVLGHPDAFAHADELEGHSHQVLNAWRARQIAHLFQCNLEAAESCRHEVERLSLAHGSRQFHHGVTLESELLAHVYTDDLLGLRRVLPGLRAMAQRHPHWRMSVLLAEANLERVRGHHGAALERYDALLAMLVPGRNSIWSTAVSGKMQVLVDMGRAEEARQLGTTSVRVSAELAMPVSRRRLDLALAEAESALGQYAAATKRAERSIAEYEARGSRGLHLGVGHEVRARVALAAGDATAFRTHFKRACQELRFGQHPATTSRLERLRDRAVVTETVADESAGSKRVSREFIERELAECTPEQRGRKALELLIRATGAESGYLYLVDARGLSLAATASEHAPPPSLESLLRQAIQRDAAMSETTVDLDEAGTSPGALEPVLLRATHRGRTQVVAAAALRFPAARRWPAPQIMDAIGDQLARATGASRHSAAT